MKLKNKVWCAITAALLPGAALCATYYIFNKTDDNEIWAEPKPHSHCRYLGQRNFSEIFYKFYDASCYKLAKANAYIARFKLNSPGEDLPVRVLIPANNDPIERVLIDISGGPGTDVLAFPRIDQLSDTSLHFSEKCNAAIITPAYSGTFHRSKYPQSSEKEAAREIAHLIETLQKSGLKIHLIAQSLGGRIVGAPEVPIPPGDHLLMLPLVQSPNQLFRYYDNDGSMAEISLRKGVQEKYRLGPEGAQYEKYVFAHEFSRAFFDREQGALNHDFTHLWKSKGWVSEGANIRVIMAREEERAGGTQYITALKSLGFDISVVSGSHIAKSVEVEHMRNHQFDRFLQDICDS